MTDRDGDTRTISIGSRTASVTGAIMGVLVLINLAGSPIGAAAASPLINLSGTGQCNAVDAQIFYFSAGVLDGQCNPVRESSTIKSMQQGQTNITKTNIYQGAAEAKSSASTHLSTEHNALTNLQTSLFAYGQNKQVNAIENGSATAQVNTAVNQSINQRVAKMQYNQLQAWNQWTLQLYSIENESRNSGVTVLKLNGSGATYPWQANSGILGSKSVSLANGTTATENVLQMTYDSPSTMYSGRRNWSLQHLPYKWDYRKSSSSVYRENFSRLYVAKTTAGPRVSLLNVSVGSPYTQETGTQAHDFNKRWSTQWTTLTQKATQAKANLAKATSSMENCYASSSCNLSSHIDALTYGQEMATSYNSTGYYGYAQAEAASLGYSIPDLNNTSTVTVNYTAAGSNTSHSYTGGLFSSSPPPGGKWVVGDTYTSANMSGIQAMATVGGNQTRSHLIQFNGSFVVTGMKNKNGTAINQTRTRQYQYTTSNASQYQQLQKEMDALRAQIKAREPTPATGGGGGLSVNLGLGGLLGGHSTLIIIIVVGGAAVLLLKED